MKTIAKNKKAESFYEIFNRYEAGIVLTGSEVKALRLGKANIKEAFIKVQEQEAWLIGLHIGSYEPATYNQHEAKRKRKILLHKHEISKLWKKTRDDGFTIIPLEIYFNDKNLVKIEIAVARGFRKKDRRQALAEKDAKRNIDRIIKNMSR